MKKLSFMIVAAGLLATSALTSCKKEEVKSSKIEKSNFNSLLRDDGKKPKKITKMTELIEDGSGETVHCPEGTDGCRTKFGALTIEQNGELDLLDSYILSGNGNVYFTTQNWDIMFDEISSQSGLLNQIINNQVHIYKVQTTDLNVDRMYVLSTAPNGQSLTNSNIVFAWQY